MLIDEGEVYRHHELGGSDDEPSRMLCSVGRLIVHQHFGMHAASLLRKGLM